MKYFNKLVLYCLLGVLLINYEVDTFSYAYNITNKTGRDIKVKLYGKIEELLPSDPIVALSKRPQLIKAGDTYNFSFTRGLYSTACLTRCKISIKQGNKWRKLRPIGFIEPRPRCDNRNYTFR